MIFDTFLFFFYNFHHHGCHLHQRIHSPCSRRTICFTFSFTPAFLCSQMNYSISLLVLLFLVGSFHVTTIEATHNPPQEVNASSFSVCKIIGSHLPSKCTCKDYDVSDAQINCTINFLNRDEIDVSATLSPCSMPAYLELRVEEEKHRIGHTFGPISAEGVRDYPVPGLSIDIPKIGEAGINAALGIDGDVENLKIEIGLDACAKVLGIHKCGEDVTKHLPIWILRKTFSFSSLCEK